MVAWASYRYDYRNEDKLWQNEIFSDDHGATWHFGGTSIGDATPNEGQAVELDPNVVLVNSRSNYDYR